MMTVAERCQEVVDILTEREGGEEMLEITESHHRAVLDRISNKWRNAFRRLPDEAAQFISVSRKQLPDGSYVIYAALDMDNLSPQSWVDFG